MSKGTSATVDGRPSRVDSFLVRADHFYFFEKNDMQKLTLLVDRGANCRGETILVSEANAARLVARGIAVVADQGRGAPPRPQLAEPKKTAKPDDEILTPGDGVSGGLASPPSNEPTPEQLGVESVFEFDGFKREVAQSLASVGIKTAVDLRNYVASGGELTKLKFVGDKTARDLIDAYCSED